MSDGMLTRELFDAFCADEKLAPAPAAPAAPVVTVTICAWCDTNREKTRAAVARGETVSHTLCAACDKKMMEEVLDGR